MADELRDAAEARADLIADAHKVLKRGTLHRSTHNLIRDLVDTLAALSTVQPAGWRLVPEEPTEEMSRAGAKTQMLRSDIAGYDEPADIHWMGCSYRAMISSAPAASTSTTEGAG